jgi:dehydrogenase/reductase SDR family member 12
MILRAAASAFFYARFFRDFSVHGYRRAARGWLPFTPDLSNQRVLVTGASGGIGQALAAGAARAGAKVIAAARSAQKLAQLDAPGAQRLTVDLSRLDAVETIIDALDGQPLDGVFLNVGVLLNQHSLTADGFETSFATNLLVPFALTEALYARGLLNPNGFIVQMSSGGMYGAKLDLDALDLRDPKRYDGMAAYAQAKRAQVELTRAWNARFTDGPRVWTTHPGWVDSDGVKSSLPWFRATLKSHLRTAEQGADTALWIASTRPQTPAEGGIWLDRRCDPEHAFAMTRGGASHDALHAWLRDALARRASSAAFGADRLLL